MTDPKIHLTSPFPEEFPYLVEQYHREATATSRAQSIFKFSDGSRLAIFCDGELKLGQDWTRLDRTDIKVHNHNPGKADNGSPASAFVKLRFAEREDDPDRDRRTAHRGCDHPTTKAARAVCRRERGQR